MQLSKMRQSSARLQKKKCKSSARFYNTRVMREMLQKTQWQPLKHVYIMLGKTAPWNAKTRSV